jgi:phosphatidylethanolamine-binding protein (PEBP) family uncharacterized protein
VKSFTENYVVPDVVNEGPTKVAEIKFGDGLHAELGNQLTPEQASIQPKVQWDGSQDKLYTLAMVDPDAPSRANHANRYSQKRE